MSIDKVILKSILSTLAAIGILIVFLFTALVCFFPSMMMKFTYDMGMDASSIAYAKRQYKHTDEIYYIAYATDVAILTGDAKKINSCGELFIKDKDFDAYCEEKNEQRPTGANSTYQQYIYSQVCVAKYSLGKTDSAVSRACELVGEAFPLNNPMAAVLVSALANDDFQTVEILEGKIEQLQVAALCEEDKAYCAEMLALIEREMDELSA